MQVDTGCMVAVEPTVRYEVKLQGGVAKSLFGGEGLFLVHFTGPGKVTLQTLPFSRTARRMSGGGRGRGQDEKRRLAEHPDELEKEQRWDCWTRRS